MIQHTYDVIEESGSWYVTSDGEPFRNNPYRSPKIARKIAEDLSRINTMWNGVFKIETSIAEAFKNTPWPYGATCVNKGSDTDPEWVLTEPYRDDDEAIRIINPDPTGHVQINIYTRELYETACQIIKIEPISDDEISEKFRGSEPIKYITGSLDPIDFVKVRLAWRRSIGISIEQTNEYEKRAKQLKAANLLIPEYTRDQYERACEIMKVPVLTDEQAMTVVTLSIVEELGFDVQTRNVPDDPITIALAYHRSLGIGKEEFESIDSKKREQATTPTEVEGEEKTRTTTT